MLEIKMFEIRDDATTISAFATKMVSTDEKEKFLLRHAGYSNEVPCILLTHIGYHKCSYDPFDWGNRTMHEAHKYILENFNKLESGDIIDVEFILGETDKPKESERLTSLI
jgi:hypothetical protein